MLNLLTIFPTSAKNQKYLVNLLLILISIILIVFIIVAISYGTATNQGKHLKCKICGEGFNYTHWLGDFYGNHCTNGSFGDENEDCGSDSACFKMNNMLSDEMKAHLKDVSEYFKHKDHHWADHFMLFEGTIRGCIKGYGWLDNCHFHNNSYYWTGDYDREPLYWRASNLCVCTTDNCN